MTKVQKYGDNVIHTVETEQYSDSWVNRRRYQVLEWRNNGNDSLQSRQITSSKTIVFQKTASNSKRPVAYLAFAALSIVAVVETAFYGLMTFLSCLTSPITGRSLVNRCAHLTATNGKVLGRLVVDLIPGTNPVNR